MAALPAFFSRPAVVVTSAVLCCFLWGSAYPGIKVGYELLAIGSRDLAAQMLFAGYRFFLSGILVLLLAALLGRSLWRLTRTHWRQVALLGLAQTTLQYVFFYIGLANTAGVKASIMNATGTFFSVLFAHWIYHNDRLSYRKALGCAIGFLGVITVNLGGGLLDFEFTLLGEGFIVIAAAVLAGSAIYGKEVSQSLDPMLMTGWQLLIGGAVLTVIGWSGRGEFGDFDVASGSLLLYLAFLSAAAFGLWSILLKHNPVSQLSVFIFLIPVFGTLLSGLVLGERVLEWKNLAALVLVCGGIWLVTRR
ncbi:DMT family transporter [Marinimicrobium alkaliphilum]|uniref:DMT family transporter n=1 Tax=Marinimicrobium alkaliphilum TaxID=2202654 RepID=UPI000DB8FD9F|nr:DMT family transporter [Marinimicrobium alkaliphilum]